MESWYLYKFGRRRTESQKFGRGSDSSLELSIPFGCHTEVRTIFFSVISATDSWLLKNIVVEPKLFFSLRNIFLVSYLLSTIAVLFGGDPSSATCLYMYEQIQNKNVEKNNGNNNTFWLCRRVGFKQYSTRWLLPKCTVIGYCFHVYLQFSVVRVEVFRFSF